MGVVAHYHEGDAGKSYCEQDKGQKEFRAKLAGIPTPPKKLREGASKRTAIPCPVGIHAESRVAGGMSGAEWTKSTRETVPASELETGLFGCGGEQFELVEGAGPVFAEEAGEGAVGEDSPTGLASRTVVGFVAGVTDALDFAAATRARFFITAVDGHVFTERGNFFGEFSSGFGAKVIGPVRERGTDGFVEALDFGNGELLGERERRELSFPEDFVGIGVADATEEARVGEGALESVVGGEKDGGELLEIGVEDFEAAGIERAEAVFAGDDVKRGALLGASFGPEKRAVGKIEGGEAARRRYLDATKLRTQRAPVKAARDHQMEDEPEAVFEADTDAFAEAADLEDFLAGGGAEGRSCSAQEERADDADRFEGLAEDAGFEGFDVNSDVGKFGHGLLRKCPKLGQRPSYNGWEVLWRRWHKQTGDAG